jgi:hypothetical protein
MKKKIITLLVIFALLIIALPSLSIVEGLLISNEKEVLDDLNYDGVIFGRVTDVWTGNEDGINYLHFYPIRAFFFGFTYGFDVGIHLIPLSNREYYLIYGQPNYGFRGLFTERRIFGLYKGP